MAVSGPILPRLLTVVLLLLLAPPACIAMAALSGIGHRWADVMAQFTAPALIAAVAVTILALLFRQGVAGAAGVFVCCLLLAANWPQWAPPKGEPQPGAPTLTLYSANLHRLNDDSSAIRASISDSRADVLVLVETSAKVVGELDQLLPDYPHRAVRFQEGKDDADGTVIASRWPVRALRNRDKLNHMVAVVSAPGGDITVVAVHLTRPWPFQYQWGQLTQVMTMTEWLNGLSGTMIVAGDFNSVSSTRVGRMVQQDLAVTPVPGWPGTWPSKAPSWAGVTIDQVYRTDDLATLSRRIGLENGSDHRPVVTVFTRAALPSEPAT